MDCFFVNAKWQNRLNRGSQNSVLCSMHSLLDLDEESSFKSPAKLLTMRLQSIKFFKKGKLLTISFTIFFNPKSFLAWNQMTKSLVLSFSSAMLTWKWPTYKDKIFFIFFLEFTKLLKGQSLSYIFGNAHLLKTFSIFFNFKVN